jgi:hypothetical protein
MLPTDMSTGYPAKFGQFRKEYFCRTRQLAKFLLLRLKRTLGNGLPGVILVVIPNSVWEFTAYQGIRKATDAAITTLLEPRVASFLVLGKSIRLGTYLPEVYC